MLPQGPPSDSNREPLHYKWSALPIELGGRDVVGSQRTPTSRPSPDRDGAPSRKGAVVASGS